MFSVILIIRGRCELHVLLPDIRVRITKKGAGGCRAEIFRATIPNGAAPGSAWWIGPTREEQRRCFEPTWKACRAAPPAVAKVVLADGRRGFTGSRELGRGTVNKS